MTDESLATPQEEKLDLSVSVEDSGPSRKKLKIDVPAEAVEEKISGSLDMVQGEAELPGFRRGRAPRRLIEKKFGSTVLGEAKKQIVAMAYQQAVEQEDLKVIGQPTSETLEQVEVKRGEPVSFEVEVEVQPEFEMPNLDGIEVKRPPAEVTEEQVDGEIEKLCVNEGDLEERESPEPGDYVTGRGIMTGPEGEEFYNIDGAVVRVPPPEDEGKGMILGVVVDDFADQFGLPKPGETATIRTTGPENHEREELRGKELTIAFEVSRVDRIIPAKVEDILAKFGMEEESQLREAIRGRLNQRAMINQQSAMRSQVAKHLLDSTEMELPQRLTANQAARTMQRQRMELLYRGVDEQEVEHRMAELRAYSAERAQRELKLFFILNRAAEELGVGVDESEINGRIAQMAMERGQRPEELRRELINQNQVGAVAQQIREHKTMDAILANANIEEARSPEEAEQAAAE